MTFTLTPLQTVVCIIYMLVGAVSAMFCIRDALRRSPIKSGLLNAIYILVESIIYVIFWPLKIYQEVRDTPDDVKIWRAASLIFPDKPKRSWCPALFGNPGDDVDYFHGGLTEGDRQDSFGWFVLLLEADEDMHVHPFVECNRIDDCERNGGECLNLHPNICDSCQPRYMKGING